MKPPFVLYLGGAALALSWPTTGARAQSDEELARQLANPIANLASVPFQLDSDHEIGPAHDGRRYTLNLQPVIPIELNDRWNLVSRSVLPFISQQDVVPGAGSKSGPGDITQSFFFTPTKPTGNGLIWGAGPALVVPTATSTDLAAKRWAIGPTGVALKERGPWTYGVLANHVWSVGTDTNRTAVNATFIQPFVSYTTKSAWTYTLNTESTYDWKARDLSMPVNLTASKILRVGDQRVSLGAGVRWWADSTDSGPHGWGVRLVATFLFPK